MRNHKGYTLIELLVAMVVLVIVTGSLYKLLVSTQRLSRAQADQVDMQSNVRTASLVIPSELRELNTVVAGAVAQNDILAMTATSIRYRAMRGIGYICQTPTISEIRILGGTGTGAWSGLRDPVGPRDSAYVFSEGPDDAVSSDDSWLPVRISGVAASTCGANTAYALAISPTVGALTSVPVNTPVRVYEVMELSLYTSGGQSWLGAQSISGGELGPQPLLGPLRPGDGLAFEYLDLNGVATADVRSVKSIRLTVRGTSTQPRYGGSSQTGTVVDSLTTQVSLRNAFGS